MIFLYQIKQAFFRSINHHILWLLQLRINSPYIFYYLKRFTKNRYVNLIHMQYNEGNSTIESGRTYFFRVSSLAYPNLLGKKGYVVVVVVVESGRTTSNFASKSYLKSNYGLA